MKTVSKENYLKHLQWGNACEAWNLAEQEGIHIAAGKKYRIGNCTTGDLEFILSLQPSTQNDRINL